MMYSENKSTKRRFAGSYFISLISITLVLFILGTYAFLITYTDKLLDHIRENIGFEIVFKSNANESSINSLKDELNKKAYVKSVSYISKEEATKKMQEDLGEDFLVWLGDVENPLLPSLDVRFVAEYANNDSIAEIENWISQKNIVKEILYQKTLTDTVNTNISRIKIVLFLASSIFLLIAIVLISHTIRLSVYSKRFVVRSMQLVGATEFFIMKPFLKTFMKMGFFAAILALILITLSLLGLKDYLPESDFFQSNTHVSIIYISVVALSLLLTMLSTIFSMKKYLNAELDKFYA